MEVSSGLVIQDMLTVDLSGISSCAAFQELLKQETLLRGSAQLRRHFCYPLDLLSPC